ncbi:hypothetical protein ABB55_18280 [Prosthecomicrobium hirschii]|uniref:Uncharacterized protein n=2 Tax=Prosthecodimorpha hirschii TaxID=665126 RepID=A0A0P6VRU6_9HYPH|nr:hypothetical protein ABB55_18280 [Prosthecomicrobium hirschii]
MHHGLVYDPPRRPSQTCRPSSEAMRHARPALALAALLVAALSLGACGRRGEPQFTPDQPPNSEVALSGPKSSEPVKPKRDFVLDPLLGPRIHKPEDE